MRGARDEHRAGPKRQLDNRGQIVRVYTCNGPCPTDNPDLSGDQWVRARGLAGASNLAVDPSGGIYITELFGDRVSYVKGGVITWVASLPSPTAIEWADGRLYVAYDLYGAGALATITP